MVDDRPAITIPEPFQLDSGLRDDMVLSIHSAYFAPSADYMDGKVLMLWLIGLDESGDAVDVRMSVGADWVTDDGNTITHPTKKKQHINKNSIYGHWLASCFEIPDLAKELITRSDTLGGKGPLDARIWIDLILHLQNKVLHFGKNIDDQERLMPTEYLGLTVDQATDSAILAGAVAETTISEALASPEATVDPGALVAAARAKAQAETAISNGSPLYARALQMAKEAPDYATFLSIALADEEILADDELAVQCADESQIWAAAH